MLDQRAHIQTKSKTVSLLFFKIRDTSRHYSFFSFPENLTQPRTLNLTQIGFSEESIYNITEDIHQLQLQRLQHLHNACVDQKIFKNVTYNRTGQIIYSSRYNFSFCKVPKAGCSFLTQVFAILQNDAHTSKDIFGLERKAVHAKLKRVGYMGVKNNILRNIRTVLVSRDPYTRLFSAYIDKMFLPLRYGTAVGIVQRQRTSQNRNASCANDITFEEFLSYIVDRAREGNPLNMHWAPIFSLCKPCNLNVLSLVKQETFSADVEYVLKEVGISNDEFDVIYDALHDHRIEATIPGIVTTVTERGKWVRRCMDAIEVARRIWVSFQIQGYIKEDIPFPTNTINSNKKAKNPEFLTNIILDTIKKHPMSPYDAKIQRRQNLVRAFNGLSKDILDKVKQIYKQDFILFDYSFEPP